MAASRGVTLTLVAWMMLAYFVSTSHSAKILIMPYHHKSHVGIFLNLGQALEDAGHEVWVLALEKFKASVGKTSITPLHFTVPPAADFNFRMEELMSESPDGEGVGEKILADTVQGFGLFCDTVMTNKHLMDTIQREKFDLAVVDGVICSVCMYMVPYKFDIPFITLRGFQVTSWDAGVSALPSIEPEISTLYSNRMDFWERLDNLKLWMTTYNNPYSEAFSESHMEKYAGDKPKITFNEVVKKSQIFLMNFEIFCLDYPRVSAPNYQFLGASTANKVKPLPADLEEFVSGAEHGIVVMSLGSMKAFQNVWNLLREKVFKAFGRLKQRVVVQYALKGDVGEVPENVRIMEWLPQNDLLGHPKTRLFVNHGGNNGQNEAVFHGVPSLVIPVILDQPYAGVRVESHGYGKYVRDKKAVTSEELHDMMTEIIYNETYSANIKKCSRIIRSLPPAKEKFVFWVNHILEFGGAHLRPASMDMPLYKVFMLDILAYYAGQALLAVHAAIFAVYFVYSKLLKARKTKKD